MVSQRFQRNRRLHLYAVFGVFSEGAIESGNRLGPSDLSQLSGRIRAEAGRRVVQENLRAQSDGLGRFNLIEILQEVGSQFRVVGCESFLDKTDGSSSGLSPPKTLRR